MGGNRCTQRNLTTFGSNGPKKACSDCANEALIVLGVHVKLCTIDLMHNDVRRLDAREECRS